MPDEDTFTVGEPQYTVTRADTAFEIRDLPTDAHPAVWDTVIENALARGREAMVAGLDEFVFQGLNPEELHAVLDEAPIRGEAATATFVDERTNFDNRTYIDMDAPVRLGTGWVAERSPLDAVDERFRMRMDTRPPVRRQARRELRPEGYIPRVHPDDFEGRGISPYRPDKYELEGIPKRYHVCPRCGAKPNNVEAYTTEYSTYRFLHYDCYTHYDAVNDIMNFVCGTAAEADC